MDPRGRTLGKQSFGLQRIKQSGREARGRKKVGRQDGRNRRTNWIQCGTPIAKIEDCRFVALPKRHSRKRLQRPLMGLVAGQELRGRSKISKTQEYWGENKQSIL